MSNIIGKNGRVIGSVTTRHYDFASNAVRTRSKSRIGFAFLVCSTTLMAILLLLFSLGSLADQSVRGYIRQDGTYVAPYMRSNPNSHLYDNYSGRGNINPYTGQRGYVPHEYSSPSIYDNGGLFDDNDD